MERLFDAIDTLKKDIDLVQPRNEQLVAQIKEYYRVALTYTCNALEGNSLTESEVKRVLHDGVTVHGKLLSHHLEVLGVSSAYDFMYEAVKTKELSEDTIKLFHRFCYNRLNTDHAGIYRKQDIFIMGSRRSLPKPQDIQECMKSWLSNSELILPGVHPVLHAARVHKEIALIHPFTEGNGRVARLVMNMILLKAGYSITLIPPHVRDVYISSLEKAHEDETDFVAFIAQMVKESQREFLRLVSNAAYTLEDYHERQYR